ncbi:MAG: metallophosphoesterase [Oscillospiraceae bacterium]|nr:metallophosphoesterase [Oscillospiraceae bacterium]
MAIFTIADLHLSCGVEKPMDVFHGWDDYLYRLEKNWHALVSEGDTVIIPGDISWGIDLAQAKDDLLYLNNLPGQKVLIKGNHDYWWPTRNKINAFFEENNIKSIRMLYHDSVMIDGIAVSGTRSWFYEEGDITSKVYKRELLRLSMSLEDARKYEPDEILVFLHYPPIYGNYIYNDFIDLMKKYSVKRCYYGHLHGNSINSAFNGVYDDIQFKLVSADALKFCPLFISK